MDVSSILLVVIFVGSMLITGELAHERGRSRSRWIWIAAFIGPFAIPLLYLLVAIAALNKTVGPPRPSN